MYKVPYYPLEGGGGSKNNVEKGKGEAILFSLQYQEEYQVGKRGRGRKFLGRNQDLKTFRVGEEYQVIGNFIHPRN